MLKLMVVDDEAFVRRGIIEETDWESLGCQVVCEAGDGKEGLEKALFFKPELIISDIRMPGKTGLEMLRELRQQGYEGRVIFLTAYSEFEYAREALKLYAFDYILKPFEDGELEEVVRRVVREVKREKGTDTALPRAAVHFLPALPQETTQSRTTLEAIRCITERYAEQELSVGEIAKRLEISDGHLSHIFKKETGLTVMNYLLLYRMERAAELLMDSRRKIYEVTERVGYRDIAYFSSCFKKVAGKSPKEWQAGRQISSEE